MALKKELATSQGFDVPEAYFRVESVALLGKDAMAFSVRAYNDAAYAAIKEDGYACGYDLNGANPIAQAYEHLKTLPEFHDAVDR